MTKSTSRTHFCGARFKMGGSRKTAWTGIVICAAIATVSMICGAVEAQQLEVKQSSDFDYKYEMDVLPSTLDLDGNSVMDFADYGTPSLSDDVLTTPAGCYIESPAGGIWESTMDFSAGYTFEARVKVVDMPQGDTAWELFAGAPGGSSAATLRIADAGCGWTSGSDLNQNSNTDDFHVFRVAQAAGSESYTVWRDEVKIAMGLGSGYAVGNALWFGDGSGAWNGTTQIDYLRFTQGAYAPSEPVIAPLEQKASSDFSWKYEMDVSPVTQDLDANGSPDFGLAPNSGITVGSGLLSYDTTADLAVMDYVESPAGGLWEGKFNPADGYTIEISLKVNEVATNSGLAIFGSLAGTNSTSFMSVGTSGQGWGGFGDNLVLGEANNSDDFHVFRLVKIPGVNQYRVWRDGVLLDGILPAGYSYGGEAFWFGDGNGAYGGDVEVDYIRFIEGAYEPVGAVNDFAPGDANRDGVVNDADAAILADNWQTLTGANWTMGDFNEDGRVDDIDATLLASNWQTGSAGSSASVPEPAVVTLMLIAGLVLSALNRRKR